jgi:hypothetical protein
MHYCECHAPACYKDTRLFEVAVLQLSLQCASVNAEAAAVG